MGGPTATRSGVLESVISLQIPTLKKKVNERTALVAKLEHTINVETIKKKTPKDLLTNRRLVDVLYERLDVLNEEITEMIEQIERLQQAEGYEEQQRLFDRYGRHVEPFQDEVEPLQGQVREQQLKQDESAKLLELEPSFSDLSASVSPHETTEHKALEHMATVPSTIGEDETMEDDDADQQQSASGNSQNSWFNFAGNLVNKTAGTVVKTANATVGVAAKTANATVGVAAKTAKGTVDVAAKTANVAAGAAAKTAAAAAKQAMSLFTSEDGRPLSSGFVTFTNLEATNSARQTIHYPQPFTMEVMDAPAPDDVFWHNVALDHKQLQVGKLISMSLTVALCLFWTIPMSFISTLSSVEGLRATIPWIDELLDKYPWLEPVLAQLAPLLLVAAHEALKIILQFCSTFEGPVSGATVTASVFAKLSVFTIIQTFFVSALSGGLVSQFSNILQDTTMIIDLLATSLPSQSTYFIQIMLVDTAVGLSVELLRFSAIGHAIARSLVPPNLTQEERESMSIFLRPFACPRDFEHADLMSITVLYFVVYFVYATIAPITSVFMFICFLLVGAAYRHQFVYIYPTKPDSGGGLYIQFMRLVPVCMLIGELTIVGFLALKKNAIASALMFPLLIITILFTMYIGQQHFKMTKFLPARECMDTDAKNNALGPMDLEFMRGKYVKPELREKKVYPRNEPLERKLRRSENGEAGLENQHPYNYDNTTIL